MSSIPIPDYNTVVEKLDELVAEKGPDFFYTNDEGRSPATDDRVMCQYVHNKDIGNEEPGCIVGQVLYRLGFTLDELTRFEGENIEGVAFLYWNVQTMYSTMPNYFNNFPGLMLLFFAQESQDKGKTWAEAVQYAKDNVDVPFGT